MKETRRKKC